MHNSVDHNSSLLERVSRSTCKFGILDSQVILGLTPMQQRGCITLTYTKCPRPPQPLIMGLLSLSSPPRRATVPIDIHFHQPTRPILHSSRMQTSSYTHHPLGVVPGIRRPRRYGPWMSYERHSRTYDSYLT
ncbi:hypothetical protein Hypma_012689 [Hypsizygus marmoreus]|uniref:Uncharacterized protein n=1 Tax=Hypsizygus marmoreus TaxID=39966 RepID=A0A369JDQ8_HYPMA|nr:hypothetical protein Hypma_012689 [Hypsizygus marmoreus]